jgi:hypothetical protein
MHTHSKQLVADLQSDSNVIISPPAMTMLERQREARFKINLDRLKEFKNEFGHTNVGYEFDDALSKWCNSVRRGSVIMTKVRKQSLREVGFDFGEDYSDTETRKRPERTNENDISAPSVDINGLVENAEVAVGTHQHKQTADILQSNINESSQNTHHLVMNTHSNKLATISQIQSDAGSPPVLNRQEQREEQQETSFKMKEFNNEFGHTNVNDKNDVALRKWFSGVRSGTVAMPVLRKQLLMEVGFTFPATIQGKIDIVAADEEIDKSEEGPTIMQAQKVNDEEDSGDNVIEEMPKLKRRNSESQRDREPKKKKSERALLTIDKEAQALLDTSPVSSSTPISDIPIQPTTLQTQYCAGESLEHRTISVLPEFEGPVINVLTTAHAQDGQTPNIETAICREYTSRTNDGLDPNSIKAAFIISKSSSTPISDIPIH